MFNKQLLNWQLIFQKNALLEQAYKNNQVKSGDINKLYNKIFQKSTLSEPITLNQVGKVYDNGFKAINNFNLKIEPGEFVSLLGPSGCGKTTILRMIAGLEYISEGTFKMGDLILNSALPQERSLSMVFQNYALYPYMDVFNNIAFGLKIGVFTNQISQTLWNEYLLLKNPFLNQKRVLRQQIRKLKNPLKETKLLVKKELILAKSTTNKDLETISLLKGKLSKIKKENLKKRQSNSAQIKNNLQKLNDLKTEYRKFKVELTKKEVANQKSMVDKAKSEHLNQKLVDLKIQNLKIKESYLKELKEKLASLLVKHQAELKNNDHLKVEIRQKLSSLKQSNSKNVWFAKGKRTGKAKDYIAQKDQKANLLKEEGVLKSNSIIAKSLYREEKYHLKKVYKDQINRLKTTKKLLQEKYKYHSPIDQKHQEYLQSLAVWKYSIPSRVVSFSKMVGIEKYLKRKPAALSGGQRQRIALVRAISKNVKLFLFDEPLSNLDAKLRSTMRSEIKSLHSKLGTTSIFVTHDQVEATTMSDKIVLMNRGYIQQIGTPDELFFAPANIFAADFIGSPRINLLEGNLISANQVQIGNHRLNFASHKTLKIDGSKAKIKVIIGIRPQEILFDDQLSAGEFKNNLLQGKIKQIENIGHERKIIVEVAGFDADFVVLLGNKYHPIKIGDILKFFINPSRIHLFNDQTGISLTAKINDETAKALDVWANSVDERVKNMILLDHEKYKEKLSSKLSKDALGLVIPRYGQKRKLLKINRQIKVYKDESPININEQMGN